METDPCIFGEVEIGQSVYKSIRIPLHALMLTGLVVFHANLIQRLFPETTFSYEKAYQAFIDQNISEHLLAEFYEHAQGDDEKFLSWITTYYFLQGFFRGDQPLSGEIPWEQLTEDDLQMLQEAAQKQEPQSFADIAMRNQTLWQDAFDFQQFPVGAVNDNPDADVFFGNSWKTPRTYGGERSHEGVDIMATVEERGIYPIYSISDGTVENIGWLPQGGYRIGIRSSTGAYYYYAHLAKYGSFGLGDEVQAGDLLGMMGDTGYSEIEGTTGNFPVHLHFGVYFNDETGKEYAINAFPLVQYLRWKRVDHAAGG